MNEKIWLIDIGEDIVWCNEPCPSEYVEEEDATGYVRMDIHQTLEKENAELKAKLAKGQESFELVLDNAASDKTTINLLCGALLLAADDMEGWASYASDYFKEKHNLERDLKELRALAKTHKQGKS